MLKITEFEKIQKNLKYAERVLGELGGELGVVNVNPHEPASIEAAIQSVNEIIDERIGVHSANPIIGSLADQMKEKY
ncbi:TPA: hypothetical protein ACSTLY_001926 [Serratia fonticola]|uniref:hypothetical protein n=1 Tax=Serratia fonticola TaxID=47917 RepID=UPI0021785FFE|nr:hypothetical protein [Serratia fonticola]CAI1528992.1 Uncharacterised protein [Serratia fonticola]